VDFLTGEWIVEIPGEIRLSDAGLTGYRSAHPGTSLGIGAALVCEGPAPRPEAVKRELRRVLSAHPGLGGASAVDACTDHLAVSDTEPHDLGSVVDTVTARPLPADGWACTIAEGLPHGRFAVVWRADHVLLDGAGVAAVLAELCRPQAEAPAPRFSSAAAREGRGAAFRQTVPDLLRAAWATGAPLLARRTTADRLLPDSAGAPGPLRHVFADTDVARLRGIGRRHGVTINDVHLAALSGALRGWAAEQQDPAGLRAVRAVSPVNIRTSVEEGVLRNRHIPVSVTLPLDIADPVERLVRVRARTRRLARSLRHPMVHTVFSALPRSVGPWCMERYFSPRRSTLLVSNVPGPPYGLTLAGARVLGVGPLNFLPAGHQLSVALATLEGRAYVGFVGLRTLPGLTGLPCRWSRELAALEAVSSDPR
jgi:diacylglycerol O-acyltransferase / wax synthase